MLSVLLMVLAQAPITCPEGFHLDAGWCLRDLQIGSGNRLEWDGGAAPPGAVRAAYYEAYSLNYHLAYLSDGGTGLEDSEPQWNVPGGGARRIAQYNCNGIGGDGKGNGQPCLGNARGIIELYGRTVGTPQEALGQTEGLCSVESYDMGSSVLSDGGTHIGPMFCVGAYGAGDKKFRVMRQGQVLIDGSLLSIRGPNVHIDTPASYMHSDVKSYNASGPAFIRRQGYGVAITSGDFEQLWAYGTKIYSVSYQGGTRLRCLPMSQLETCGAGQVGTVICATNGSGDGGPAQMFCNGSSWVASTQ